MLKKIKNNKLIKLLGNILYGISFVIILLILIVVLIQRFSNNNIAIFGIRIFCVASGSMLPEYEVGDILISAETDPENINVGDAITYLGDEGSVDGRVVTHQVIKRIPDENGKYLFITKGTANAIEDPVVSEDQIYGKVVYKVVTLSFICKLLQNLYGFYFIIIVPLAIIIAKIMFNIIVARHEKQEENNEDEEKDKPNDTELSKIDKNEIELQDNKKDKEPIKINTDDIKEEEKTKKERKDKLRHNKETI